MSVKEEAGRMISFDVHCVKCEYNLRGLSETGLCPECGSSIAVSLREHDNPTGVSGRPYRRAALVGLCCVLIGLAIIVLPMSPPSTAGSIERGSIMFALLSFTAGILIELGVVLMSVRYFLAARKTDHRAMVVALIISIPFVPIAIALGPAILMSFAYL